jgi:hypothetical protein
LDALNPRQNKAMKRNLLIVSAALALFLASRAAQANIYVTHVDFTLNGGVSAFSDSGTALPTSGPGGFAPINGLKAPMGVVVANNNLFVANRGDGTVGLYNVNTGAPINTQLITGLKKPGGLAFRANTLYVSEFGGGTVKAYQFNQNNTVTPLPGFTTITGLQSPTGLSVDNHNFLLVASYGSGPGAGTVRAFDATEGGEFLPGSPLVSGLTEPTGIIVQGSTLYVSDQDGTVGQYTFHTNPVTASGSQAFIKGLDSPMGLAFATDGTLLVVSPLTGTVNKFSAGVPVSTTPFISLSGPTGIAVK